MILSPLLVGARRLSKLLTINAYDYEEPIPLAREALLHAGHTKHNVSLCQENCSINIKNAKISYWALV